MHEKRNFIMILMLVGSSAWSVAAWLLMPPETPLLLFQKVMSVGLALSLAAWLVYAMRIEDKLPDHLRQVVGEFYYEADGLSFMPMIRMEAKGRHAELCVYYQNRFENVVEAIVHLRPPPAERSFVIQPGVQDVHFAFRAGGGDFGVIHQPIAVPRHIQGEVIEVKMSASSWYPRSKGACLRRRPGMNCGTLSVDWAGNPLRVGVHEVSTEIELHQPVTLRLPMPECVQQQTMHTEPWRQERLATNDAVMA